MELSTVIAIGAVAWSAGLFCGMFTANFVSKKEFREHRQEVWGAINSLRDCLTGGKLTFHLRQVREGDTHE